MMAASAAMGAVSVRRMRGPSVAGFAPAVCASCTSSGVKPPSGPMKSAHAVAVGESSCGIGAPPPS